MVWAKRVSIPLHSRPMDSLMIKVKMATLGLSAAALVYIFGFMRPSSTCGPFEDYA